MLNWIPNCPPQSLCLHCSANNIDQHNLYSLFAHLDIFCNTNFDKISRFLCGSLNNRWTSCWRRAWGEKKCAKLTFLFEAICWYTTRNVLHVTYLSTVMGVTGSFPLQRSAWKHSFIKASWLEHDPEPHINTKLGLILLTLIVLNTWMFFSSSYIV